MPQQRQRRNTPRRQVAIDLTLDRPRGNPITGHTVDVGGGGMKIITTRPLAVDEVLFFHLPIPAKSGKPVDGRARVLREAALNTYALRFEDLDAHDRLLLSRFVGEAA